MTRLIDADAFSELVGEPIEVFLSRLDLRLPPTVDAEPVIRCKDCRFFETNHWEKVNKMPLIVAHEICTRWGKGCKTAEDGFCFMAERKEE